MRPVAVRPLGLVELGERAARRRAPGTGARTPRRCRRTSRRRRAAGSPPSRRPIAGAGCCVVVPLMRGLSFGDAARRCAGPLCRTASKGNARLGRMTVTDARASRGRAFPCRPRCRGAAAWPARRRRDRRRLAAPGGACGRSSRRAHRRRGRTRRGRCRATTTPSPVDGSYDLMTPCTARPQPALTTLAALDAAGAHVQPLRRAADEGAHALDVRVPATLGATVRVRHGHAPARALAAHFTNCCHDVPSSASRSKRAQERYQRIATVRHQRPDVGRSEAVQRRDASRQ